MDSLTRVLRIFAGLLIMFAGYFLMAAEGWGEPLDHMFVERVLVGGFVILIGLGFVIWAFRPPPPPPPQDDPPQGGRSEPPGRWVDSAPDRDPSRLIVHPIAKTDGRSSLDAAADPAASSPDAHGPLASVALLRAAEDCELPAAPFTWART